MGSSLVGPGRRALRVGVALLALTLLPAALQAQDAVPERKTMWSLNPLGLPFEYVSTELERKLSRMATLGASLSYLGIDDNSYLSVEGKVRLYPNEEAFRGFSIGLAGGFSRLQETYYGGLDGAEEDRSTTRPTIAVLADYNWLLGKSKRILVGTGVGAKRIFGDDDFFSDINFAYPTARFQIGVLF